MRLIHKYCWIGISLLIIGLIILSINLNSLSPIIGGFLIGLGVAVISLNFAGKLKK